MKCRRCASIMIETLPLSCMATVTADFWLLADGRDETGYSCPMCGNYEDATVLRNRMKQIAGEPISIVA